MVTKGSVAVVGRSMHIAGLAASLRLNLALQVVRVHPDSPAARREIDELVPDVVIFDLVEPYADLTLALLHERPGLLLLGMDPSRNDMLVLSGQSVRAESLQDMVQAINQQFRILKDQVYRT